MNRPVLYIGLIFILLIASCDKPTSTKKNSSSPKKSNASYMFSIARQGTVLAFSPTKSIVTFNAPFTDTLNRQVKKDITVADDTGVISYKSSDDAIATVDENTGLVTPKAIGEVTITATKAATTNKYLQSEATYTLVIEKFKPHNKNALLIEIKAATAVRGMNADLNYIDTSLITDMSDLFSNTNKLSAFEGNISQWNVSNVTTMTGMFDGAKAFNSDISKWNVLNVTNMWNMFRDARAFNSDISKWNVLNVTNMNDMFDGARAFNSDISKWNVSNVTNMDHMFYNASTFNQDISEWNVSKVTSMYSTFFSATAFNQDISGWNVSKVTNMNHMFYNASTFNQDISGWNVSKVTTMSNMFHNASAFNQDISGWNVLNVTAMRNMFYNARAFNQDISGWNVSNVTAMRNMFYNARAFNQNLNNWESTLNNAVKANSWKNAENMFKSSGLAESLPTWCENVQECKSKQ